MACSLREPAARRCPPRWQVTACSTASKRLGSRRHGPAFHLAILRYRGKCSRAERPFCSGEQKRVTRSHLFHTEQHPPPDGEGLVSPVCDCALLYGRRTCYTWLSH